MPGGFFHLCPQLPLLRLGGIGSGSGARDRMAGWRPDGGELRRMAGAEGQKGGSNEKMDGKWGNGRKRPFRFGWRPQASPGGLGSARVRRLLFRLKPATNKDLGARPGRFFAAGAKKRALGHVGGRVEVL